MNTHLQSQTLCENYFNNDERMGMGMTIGVMIC